MEGNYEMTSAMPSLPGIAPTTTDFTKEGQNDGFGMATGPTGYRSVGHLLTPQPLPQRLLFAEPLQRRMRVRLGDPWVADSEDVVLLHEPGRYPVAYFA